MTTIYTQDGATVTKRFRIPPRWHWVQTDPDHGHYVPADTTTGYYPLTETDRPDTDHTRSIVRQGDTFVEVWTFDQTLADARAVAEADEAERDQARQAVANLDQYLAIESPTAAQAVQTVGYLARVCRRLIIDQYGPGS